MRIKEKPPPLPELEFISTSLGYLCAFLIDENDKLRLTGYR